MGSIFKDVTVYIPKVVYRRFEMMTEEIHYLNDESGLSRIELADETEKIITNVLTEYVRQHFEESTKAAVQMAIGHQPRYRQL